MPLLYGLVKHGENARLKPRRTRFPHSEFSGDRIRALEGDARNFLDQSIRVSAERCGGASTVAALNRRELRGAELRRLQRRV
jgi:hypothetical protein